MPLQNWSIYVKGEEHSDLTCVLDSHDAGTKAAIGRHELTMRTGNGERRMENGELQNTNGPKIGPFVFCSGDRTPR